MQMSNHKNTRMQHITQCS